MDSAYGRQRFPPVPLVNVGAAAPYFAGTRGGRDSSYSGDKSQSAWDRATLAYRRFSRWGSRNAASTVLLGICLAVLLFGSWKLVLTSNRPAKRTLHASGNSDAEDILGDRRGPAAMLAGMHKVKQRHARLQGAAARAGAPPGGADTAASSNPTGDEVFPSAEPAVLEPLRVDGDDAHPPVRPEPAVLAPFTGDDAVVDAAAAAAAAVVPSDQLATAHDAARSDAGTTRDDAVVEPAAELVSEPTAVTAADAAAAGERQLMDHDRLPVRHVRGEQAALEAADAAETMRLAEHEQPAHAHVPSPHDQPAVHAAPANLQARDDSHTRAEHAPIHAAPEAAHPISAPHPAAADPHSAETAPQQQQQLDEQPGASAVYEPPQGGEEDVAVFPPAPVPLATSWSWQSLSAYTSAPDLGWPGTGSHGPQHLPLPAAWAVRPRAAAAVRMPIPAAAQAGGADPAGADGQDASGGHHASGLLRGLHSEVQSAAAAAEAALEAAARAEQQARSGHEDAAGSRAGMEHDKDDTDARIASYAAADAAHATLAQLRDAAGPASSSAGTAGGGGDRVAHAAAEVAPKRPSIRGKPLPRLAADVHKRDAVKEAFLHSWRPYKEFAWGQDTLKPVSKRGDNGFLGLGITITDSLDTLAIMGLSEELQEVRAIEHVVDRCPLCDAAAAGLTFLLLLLPPHHFDLSFIPRSHSRAAHALLSLQAIAWVESPALSFGHQENINLFESFIRVLGGLLSAWELTQRAHPGLLAKAKACADAMMFAFDSSTGLPFGTVSLASHSKYNPAWVQGASTIAEVATLQLELEYLSHATGDPRYALAGRRVMGHLSIVEPSDGLWPMFIHPDSGVFTSSTITLGARGDSLYEYLVKQPLLAGLGLRSAQQPAAHADGTDAAAEAAFPLSGIVGNAAMLRSSVPLAEMQPPESSHAARAAWQSARTIACQELAALAHSRRQIATAAAAAATGGGGGSDADADADADSALAAPHLGLDTKAHGGSVRRMWYACTDAAAAPCFEPAGLAGAARNNVSAGLIAGAPVLPAAFPWHLGVDAAACGFAGQPELQLASAWGAAAPVAAPAPAANVGAAAEASAAGHAAGADGEAEAAALAAAEAVAAVDAASTSTGGARGPSSDRLSEASYFAGLHGMWLRSVAGIDAHLLRRSAPSGFTYIAERHGEGRFEDKQDHLVCFMAGALALSARVAPTDALSSRHLQLGEELADTCVHTYRMTATGLAPEITRFPGGGDPVVDAGSKHNLLRPETMESLFVLYRLTGDDKWRAAGWDIFTAFNTHARVPEGGYSTLADVTVVPPFKSDHQESFWLAETLKYAYLLFADSDTIPLDRFVFNTEAHPLPVFGTV